MNKQKAQEGGSQHLLEEYIKANLDQDFEKVNSLFEHSGVRSKQEEFRKNSPVLYSADMNYVHEPYWSYNVAQLRDYGKRIVEKIHPYFIDEKLINLPQGEVEIEGKKVKIRRVTEFGRVLPLLYLQDQLARENNLNLAVPRLFIVPNQEEDIKFDFSMPYLNENHRNLVLDSGNNILKIQSDNFTIYQEYIEGAGNVGDRSFMLYGHTDFNAKQIIKSNDNEKKYLIDTKEGKNFFIAPLNPMADGFYMYWQMNIGRVLPQKIDKFQTWQRKQQRLMLQAKKLHFPLKMRSIQVNIGKLSDFSLDIETVSPHCVMFDESKPYFKDPKQNLTRYLKIGRYDLFLKILTKEPNLSLSGVLVPKLFNYQKTLIELILDLLWDEYFEQNEENTKILTEILGVLISRVESTQEAEQLKLMALIAPKSQENPKDKFSFELGMKLLREVLEKQEKPSMKLLEDALESKNTLQYQDTSILEMVLDFSNNKIIEATLKNIHSPVLIGRFSNISEENRVMLMKILLHRLSFLSDNTVRNIISFDHKELVEILLEKDFNVGYALYLVATVIDEPSQFHLNKCLGKSGDVNWYWYDVAERILAKKPSEDAIDTAMAYLLNNDKITLLEILLKQKPKLFSKTDSIMKQLLESQYHGSRVFEKAIEARCILVIDLFLTHGRQIGIHQFRMALKTRNDDMLKVIIQSGNLENSIVALQDAISHRNIPAIQLLAQNTNNLSSDICFQALKTKDDAIIDIIKNALPKRASVMYQMQVDKLFDDKEAAQKLIDSEIDLDKALFSAIKQIDDPCHSYIRYLIGNKTPIDYYWYDVVNEILAKQPSEDAIDIAAAYALNNSKLDILRELLKVKPFDSPKLDETLKEILKSPYSGDSMFENAIKSNNTSVVSLMLEGGKRASRYQRGLAYHHEMIDLLDSQNSVVPSHFSPSLKL